MRTAERLPGIELERQGWGVVAPRPRSRRRSRRAEPTVGPWSHCGTPRRERPSDQSLRRTRGRNQMRYLSRSVVIGLLLAGSRCPRPGLHARAGAGCPRRPDRRSNPGCRGLAPQGLRLSGQQPDPGPADQGFQRLLRLGTQQTGVDPTNPTAPPKADTSKAGKGGAVKGAAKGAAGGAAVGAIAGDTGEGAAIGATVGAAKGVKSKKEGGGEGRAQATQQQQAAVNDQITAFKKAYTACIRQSTRSKVSARSGCGSHKSRRANVTGRTSLGTRSGTRAVGVPFDGSLRNGRPTPEERGFHVSVPSFVTRRTWFRRRARPWRSQALPPDAPAGRLRTT